MKQIKTIKGLALELTKREGKKKQVNIAQMSETLSVLSDMVFSSAGWENDCIELLYRNGKRRAKKKAKSCKK